MFSYENTRNLEKPKGFSRFPIPILSGSEVVKALEKIGFVVARQKGSHIIMRKGSAGCVVPKHKEIKVGTLSGILKQAGVPLDEFLKIGI